jgi:hypothetical protein
MANSFEWDTDPYTEQIRSGDTEFKEYYDEAEHLSSELMRSQFGSREPQQILDVETPLNDVRRHIWRFRICLASLQHYKQNEYPCVVVDESTIPLDWLQARERGYWRRGQNISFLDWLKHFKGFAFQEQFKYPVKTVPPERAITYFEEGLTHFLAGRLRNRGREANQRCGAGVHLTVMTNRSGLEIESSPRNFLSWSHFGAPTPQVDDCIAAGWYHFQAVEWDSATASHRTRYQTSAPRYIGGSSQTEQLPV